jgi:hypothetical protein
MQRNILSVLTLTLSLMAGLCFGQSAPQVTIKDIIENTTITGGSSNVPAEPHATACVVVYVHTDVWYIHPYADAGLDKSYALIESNGDWQLATVKRQFPANKIAAIILKNTHECESVPARTNDITKIQNRVALHVYDLKGSKRQWYGSL